ncbi:MAG TPA: hypothetical protein PKY78_01045 [Candidatus Omnitrophota bacterium]|nr:hypothetical protein [Candidatus Omnitrophota bacterium]HPS19565.1 hypothetical protein [Candidatus Omnitrophota bacterium]
MINFGLDKTIKEKLLIVFISAWVIIWVIFLIRPDKKGQYPLLFKLYAARGEERIRTAFGADMYDTVIFCKNNMRPGATYRMYGFEKYSINEVRARYLLWPAKCTGDVEPDYKIVFGGGLVDEKGYLRTDIPAGKGYLLRKERS